jgi:hypothetical protein
MRCAMTGREFADPSQGLWSDGEWVSWNYINRQLQEQDQTAEFPHAKPETIEVFENLIDLAREYKKVTGRYLPFFGEMGELYAEMKYGIRRHKPGTRGSDGKLGNDFVEVKTISPEKRARKIRIKRSGNFNKVVVVKISAGFEFESRMIDRRVLSRGCGKFIGTTWQSTEKQRS